MKNNNMNIKNLFNFLLILICLFCYNPDSKASDIFTVENILIEESGSTSSNAKTIGVNKAKQDAFQIVLQRILMSSDVADLLNSNTIDIVNSFVSEIKISNEQTSQTKYKANIDISFGASLIGEYLRDKGYKFVTDTPSNTLILAVITDSQGEILFSQTERLINSINDNKNSSDNIIPITIPLNTKNILSKILSHDNDLINKLNEQYDTTSSIIIYISNFDSKTLNLNLLKTDTSSYSDFSLSMADPINLYDQLAKSILRISNDIYKKDIMNGKGYKNELTAVFVIKSISDILKIEQMLTNINYINSVFVKAVSQNMIQLYLKIKTNKKSIIRSLTEKGFIIEDKDKYILIK